MLTKPPVIIEGPGGLMDGAKIPPRDYVQRVFEKVGGEEFLEAQALKDPKWFLEKIWGKIIQPEKVIVQPERSVAELLKELDAKMVNVTPTVETPDADPDN